MNEKLPLFMKNRPLSTIGTKVEHSLFGKGQIVRLNMSGPIVKFEEYDSEMCCPEWSLTEIRNEKVQTTNN